MKTAIRGGHTSGDDRPCPCAITDAIIESVFTNIYEYIVGDWSNETERKTSYLHYYYQYRYTHPEINNWNAVHKN